MREKHLIDSRQVFTGRHQHGTQIHTYLTEANFFIDEDDWVEKTVAQAPHVASAQVLILEEQLHRFQGHPLLIYLHKKNTAIQIIKTKMASEKPWPTSNSQQLQIMDRKSTKHCGG
jgi:hypothetical protein